MRNLLIVLLLVVSSLGWGSTIVADSASYSDVSDAIAAATYGDTVTVPSGTETWSSTLTITKGITLEGAGAGSTVITASNGDAIIYDPDSTTISGDHLFTLTGFTFDGNDSSGRLLYFNNDSSTTTVRIAVGNNTLRDQTGTVIETDGQVRGVIYSNTIDRCNVLLKPMGNDTTTEWNNFDHSDSVFGSADNLYFEDNTIQWSSAATRSDPGWVESGHSGRIVVRYNTWDMTNSSENSEYWDVHGFQYWSGGSGINGTMNVEYYGNIITNGNSPYRWIHHRAYKALFFNNRASGSGGYYIDVSQYSNSCYSDTGTDFSEIEGAYFWNNWENGSRVDAQVSQNNCGTLVENDRFWNYDASFDGSTGIGAGSSAPTGSCTTGVGFWVTSYSPASTPPTTMEDMKTYCQAGAFYKATSTDTWELVYEPYTYPHPLRDSGNGGNGGESSTGLIMVLAQILVAVAMFSGGLLTIERAS